MNAVLRTSSLGLFLIACLVVVGPGCGSGGGGGGEAPPTDTSEIPEVSKEISESEGGAVLSNDYGVTFEPGALGGDARVTVRESDTDLDVSLLEHSGASATMEVLVEHVGTPKPGKLAASITSATTIQLPHNPLGELAFVVIYNKVTGVNRVLEATYDRARNLVLATANAAWLGAKWSARAVYRVIQGRVARLLDFDSGMLSSNERILVLVHGILASGTAFTDDGGAARSLYSVAYDDWYDGRVLRYEYPYCDSIATNADRLFTLLNETVFQHNAAIQVDLIGHSMGGLLARKFTIDHSEKVGALVTLGSPHQGAPLANLAEDLLNGGSFATDIREFIGAVNPFCDGGRDLKPGSSFLNSMNQSDTPLTRSVRYLTVYGDADGDQGDWIVPVGSADMTHADFPPTHENVGGVESFEMNRWHKRVKHDYDGLFDRLATFLGYITVPHVASSGVSIDGLVGASEWGDAFHTDCILVSGTGDDPIRCDVQMMHDGQFLYVAVETPLQAGFDAKARLRIDGDDSGTLNGSAGYPYGDVSTEQGAPGAHPLYTNYVALTSEGAYTHVTPGAGAAKASQGTSTVDYEFKVPLADLTALPGDAIRLALTASADGYDMYFWPRTDASADGGMAPKHPPLWAVLELESTNDVALSMNGGTATGSSTGSYLGQVQYPYYGNDGTNATSWSNSGHTPTPSSPAWLEIEFDAVYTIDRVGVWWSSHQHTYSISLSTNGSTWTTVVPSRLGNSVEGSLPAAPEQFDITAMDARYIRVDVTSTSAPGSHIFQASVAELQAFAR